MVHYFLLTSNKIVIYTDMQFLKYGFGIVSVSDDGSYGVEPVIIQNGVACISTLGCTISA
jgi:hypothetical protein